MAQFIDWGSGKEGNLTISAGNLGGVGGFGVATFTGTSGNNYGTFSDVGYFNGGNGGRVGDLCIIHQSQGTGAGNWEIVRITNRSGTTVYFDRNLTNTYVSGAQIQSAPNLNGGTISGNLGPYTAWNGSTGGIIFIVDKGTLTVSGTISVNASGFRAGASVGNDNARRTGQQGEGTIGGLAVSVSAAGNGGGGGQGIGSGDFATGGSGGGNGTAGTAGAHESGKPVSYPGSTAGVTGLTTMVFGGGGGSNGTGPRTTSSVAGGKGAGIILIFAKAITITGTISLTGGNGTTSTGEYYSTSGSGAGGSCLIKCQTGVLGTNKITANGGTTPSAWNSLTGGSGGAGRIHCDYFTSVSGSTNPTLSSAQDLTLTVPEGGNFIPFFM